MGLQFPSASSSDYKVIHDGDWNSFSNWWLSSTTILYYDIVAICCNIYIRFHFWPLAIYMMDCLHPCSPLLNSSHFGWFIPSWFMIEENIGSWLIAGELHCFDHPHQHVLWWNPNDSSCSIVNSHVSKWFLCLNHHFLSSWWFGTWLLFFHNTWDFIIPTV